jgi:hypothetical protein
MGAQAPDNKRIINWAMFRCQTQALFGQVLAKAEVGIGLEVDTHDHRNPDNLVRRFEDVVNEVDGASLRMALVNFQGAHPRGVVNRCILVTLDLLTLLSIEDQELDVHLDVMTRHLLVVAPGVHLSQAGPPRQAVQSMALEGAIDSCVGDFDGVYDADNGRLLRHVQTHKIAHDDL